jgi:hypothetical protein
MSEEEREAIIAQLALTEGVHPSVFQNYTDRQLRERINSFFGGESNE